MRALAWLLLAAIVLTAAGLLTIAATPSENATPGPAAQTSPRNPVAWDPTREAITSPDKLQHLLAGAGFTALLAAWSQLALDLRHRRVLVAAGGVLVLGALIELVQLTAPGRTPSLADGLATAFGGAVVVGVWIAGMVVGPRILRLVGRGASP